MSFTYFICGISIFLLVFCAYWPGNGMGWDGMEWLNCRFSFVIIPYGMMRVNTAHFE